MPSKEKENKTRLHRHRGGFRWQGIKTEKYKLQGGEWAHVIRRVIVGRGGESSKFHFRYFEISPGGYTSFEKHRHEHVVICVRGKGKVRTDNKINTMNYLDALYISPQTPHQLRNPFDEPFGFFCIVNAKRDKPKPLK